ncbi:hypothetical protein F2Q68_00011508 [Brassica cretica]|uniref:Uncharacterized protein n=1 Tax=Brassica cretica TaxID=69181 RepID=A0A8S9KV14_BRACR|nr:hypothetical protein F2Q68_00011508 [Brassica cretica]
MVVILQHLKQILRSVHQVLKPQRRVFLVSPDVVVLFNQVLSSITGVASGTRTGESGEWRGRQDHTRV